MAAAVVCGLAVLAPLAWDRRLARLLGRFVEVLAILATGLVSGALCVGGLPLVTGLRSSAILHIVLALGALATLPVALAIGIES